MNNDRGCKVTPRTILTVKSHIYSYPNPWSEIFHIKKFSKASKTRPLVENVYCQKNEIIYINQLNYAISMTVMKFLEYISSTKIKNYGFFSKIFT